MSNNKISITSCFNYDISIEEQIELISLYGFTHFSLGMDYEHSGIFDENRIITLKNKLSECNILIDTIHNSVDLDNENWYEVLNKIIKAAGFLDTKVIVIHCSKFMISEYEYQQRLMKLEEKIKKIEQLCIENNVRVAIENVAPGFADLLLEEALRISNPRYIGFCYDSSHNQIDGPRDFKLLEKWKDRVIAVHISDRIKEFVDHVIPGEGFINFSSITDILKSIDLKIPFLLEVEMTYSQYKDVNTFLQKAYKSACRLLGNIG